MLDLKKMKLSELLEYYQAGSMLADKYEKLAYMSKESGLTNDMEKSVNLLKRYNEITMILLNEIEERVGQVKA